MLGKNMQFGQAPYILPLSMVILMLSLFCPLKTISLAIPLRRIRLTEGSFLVKASAKSADFTSSPLTSLSFVPSIIIVGKEDVLLGSAEIEELANEAPMMVVSIKLKGLVVHTIVPE